MSDHRAHGTRWVSDQQIGTLLASGGFRQRAGPGAPRPQAAKPARYAIELAAPVLTPKIAKRSIRKATALHNALGVFQDSVVAADTLLQLGIRVGTAANENGFPDGMLYALEQRRAELVRRTVVERLTK